MLGSLWTDLNQRKAQGTVAEEPVTKKSSKMSVQLKDTQPSIWNPERNTTHASVVARDLGRARRLMNAAPPGVKVSCEFASASSGDE